MDKSNAKLNCVYVLKHRNTMWLGSSYTCACQIWYSSKWGRIQRKKNLCTVCLCLCAHAWGKLCVLIISVWACLVLLLWHVMSWLTTKDSKSSSWDSSATSFLNRNSFFFHWRFQRKNVTDHKCYDRGETWQQRAILVSLGLVYYFRLNTKFREEYKAKMEEICVEITFTEALDDEVWILFLVQLLVSCVDLQ